jgi:hypothetical protein
VVVAMLLLVAFTGFASASAQPSPGTRLLTYLWEYNHWLLRPYVMAVSLSGGHVVVVNGRPHLTGATANVRETLHDQPSFAKASWLVCQVAMGGVRTLHLGRVSTVRVWSVEGHTVARC